MMPSITKSGGTFRITASLGYGNEGKLIRKTTTFRPPEGSSGSQARKLAEAFAQDFERKVENKEGMN